MNRRKELQPWRYFGISLAFFWLILPKLSVFTGSNGALGILGSTLVQCLCHRAGLALRGKLPSVNTGVWKNLKSILLSLWCMAVLVGVTFLAAFLVRDCFWPGMSLGMAWGLCLLILLPALGKPKRVWQRIVAASFFFVSFFLILLPAMAARQIRPAYAAWLLQPEPKKVLMAGVLYFLLSWYLLLLPETGKKAMWPDSREGLYLLNALFLGGGCILMGLVYGQTGSDYRRWPILTLLQGVSVPGEFLERVDTFWAAACVFALFLACGLLLERVGRGLHGLGVPEISPKILRYKDGIGVVLLFGVLLLYGYQGVEAQNRLYISTLAVDWQEDTYVFWFPTQTGEETMKITGDSFNEAKEILSRNSMDEPDFGHIEVTILGDDLLGEEKATERLFAELAAWQDMDENSYVYRCGETEKLLQEDLGEVSLGQYLTGLYENHFGPEKACLTLGELMTDWENGLRGTAVPRVSASATPVVSLDTL